MEPSTSVALPRLCAVLATSSAAVSVALSALWFCWAWAAICCCILMVACLRIMLLTPDGVNSGWPKWQYLHRADSLQPRLLRKNLHGVQLPWPCSRAPRLGRPSPGATTSWSLATAALSAALACASAGFWAPAAATPPKHGDGKRPPAPLLGL